MAQCLASGERSLQKPCKMQGLFGPLGTEMYTVLHSHIGLSSAVGLG